MKKDPLIEISKAATQIKLHVDQLELLQNALMIVGLQDASQLIHEVRYQIGELTHQIKNEVGTEITNSVRQAEESSATMLKAVLAGAFTTKNNAQPET